MDSRGAVVIDVGGLDLLIRALVERGYETRGPVVRGEAVVPGQVTGVADLPVGCHDEQSPGRYRLRRGDDQALFAWAVGPGSWKAEFFPPSQDLCTATGGDGSVTFTEPGHGASGAPIAIVGARPCELAALKILDRVLMGGAVADPHYASRREGAFVVVAECTTPAGTCFCRSMGTGPGVMNGEQTESPSGVDGAGFDLALIEIDDAGGHRFLVRAGTERGARLLAAVPGREPAPDDLETRDRLLEAASRAMGRRLDTGGLPALLARNLEHPRWDEVAERCLACGNCTLVCPTCFCSDVRDTSDLSGEVRRQRVWASCFDLEHSHLVGGPVRKSTSSRYRQWLTHKLSTWWDQFDTSGCVGCGRCIAWCPVGIDLTEEAAAIRASDGATRPGAGPKSQRR